MKKQTVARFSLSLAWILLILLVSAGAAFADCGGSPDQTGLDANRDGAVTKEEYTKAGGCPMQFSTLDKNGDLRLSAQEQMAMHSGKMEAAKEQAHAAVEQGHKEVGKALMKTSESMKEAEGAMKYGAGQTK
jgi:hypothetical protein